MKGIARWFVLPVLLLAPLVGWSLEVADVIIQDMQPRTITLIGETHQKPESIRLIEQLLAAASTQQCLILALEIDDREQPVIDQVMNGSAQSSAIKIPATIDHPAFREMLADLAKPGNHPPCFQLVAIDTGIDTEYDRDEWMTKRLSELPNDRPILALLGGLHTLKRVTWTNKTGKPSVAELLDRKGYRVKSYPQRWLPENCPADSPRVSRFVNAKASEALSVLNTTLMNLIKAKKHRSATGVIDGFILWECKL